MKIQNHLKRMKIFQNHHTQMQNTEFRYVPKMKNLNPFLSCKTEI